MKKKITIPKEYKYISAFLTMRCNLRCDYCLNKSKKGFLRGRFLELSGEEWIEGLNRINNSSNRVPITFSGGEPFMHKNFVEIINLLNPELDINILTNLYPTSEAHKKRLNHFLRNIDPDRIKRNSKYPSIRVSYHPDQMNPRLLIHSVQEFLERGFDIGIYSVKYPSPSQLEAITQMQFMCLDEGVLFRTKDFTGIFSGKDDFGNPFSITYGDYSKYPGSTFQESPKKCLCRTSELLIGPNGDVYKCHRDLYSEEFPIGNILGNLNLAFEFRECARYGNCHPCDVKLKTNYQQELGHTSVDIKDIQS